MKRDRKLSKKRELIRERKLKAHKEGRRGGFRVTMEEVDSYIARKHKEMEEVTR